MSEHYVNNKDKYFKGQQEFENYICFFRHHWISLLREFVYFAIFLTVVIYTVIMMDEIAETISGHRELKLLFFAGYLIGTVYLHRFFLKMLNFFVNTGIITDLRIIDHKKTLYFVDSVDSIDMQQIQNMERVAEGVLPSLLGFGDIRIYLNASNAVITFQGVPNAKFHYRCISRVKEARQNVRRRDPSEIFAKIPTENLDARTVKQ